MQAITRTLSTTVCNGQRINEHGEFEDYTATLPGDFNATKASIRLRRLDHDPTITINNVEVESKRYRLSAEDFMTYAKPID